MPQDTDAVYDKDGNIIHAYSLIDPNQPDPGPPNVYDGNRVVTEVIWSDTYAGQQWSMGHQATQFSWLEAGLSTLVLFVVAYAVFRFFGVRLTGE